MAWHINLLCTIIYRLPCVDIRVLRPLECPLQIFDLVCVEGRPRPSLLALQWDAGL